jgi:hypothetical protein
LKLPVIPATSPTLAEAMRQCALDAGLARTPGSSAFVLGNPKAWLGTVYHDVLEKIAQVDLHQESIEAAVDRIWSQAIMAMDQRRASHGLDRRYGPPQTWPGYHAARASVLLRARELVAGLPHAPPSGAVAASGGVQEIIREHKFSAFGGRLVGTPDVIRNGEIIDYKSGRIHEFDDGLQANVVKAAYVRQLCIYGYLVNENLGFWPQRGILLPLIGAGVEVDLVPEDCVHEASEAVALLAEYNEKASNAEPVGQLASPSTENCRWCSYKVLCPAFWQTAVPEWSGQLDGGAIEGVLAETPTAIHAGAAVAITVDVERGSELRRRVRIAPLSLSTHTSVGSLTPGSRLRLVGLRVRDNGDMTPGDRTVIFTANEVPSVIGG